MPSAPVRDAGGTIVAAAVIARDMTERLQYEGRLRYLADYDQLTGLYNRRRFEEEVKHELARSGRYHAPGAVLSIDLDNFKSNNDSAGHAAGDAVLMTVARVLKRRLRSADVMARLGGDEFVVVCEDVEGEADAVMIAREPCCPDDGPCRHTTVASANASPRVDSSRAYSRTSHPSIMVIALSGVGADRRHTRHVLLVLESLPYPVG